MASAVIVHRDNPVQQLDKQQLIDIYTKKLPTGSVGGEDATIVVANKAEGRSTLEVFLTTSDSTTADVKADVVVGKTCTSSTPSSAIPTLSATSPSARRREEKSGTPIKLVTTDGVVPSRWSRSAMAPSPSRGPSMSSRMRKRPRPQAFLDYLMSTEIHDIIEKHFFVPVR
jgi:phosphate transport system substrate-binding protein